MKRILLERILAIILCLLVFPMSAQVLDPNDPIVEYDENNPPVKPPLNEIGKWVRTKRLNWNTDNFKCYYYNGMAFRLRFPENYDTSGNTKYPMIIMLHGRGEGGEIYDNENNIKHGGGDHEYHVKNGDFNGFLFFPQNTGGFWADGHYDAIHELLTIHFPEQIHLDQNRVIIHGLSAGGQGTWKYLAKYPKTIAAALPMAAASFNYEADAEIYKYKSIWLSQGAQDRAPSPSTSWNLVNRIVQEGGNIRYTLYHNLGHGVWYTHYNEADFWPFILRANLTNPVVLNGELTLIATGDHKDEYEFITKYEFCPGEDVIANLGITGGFESYEWRKDGQVIEGETTNELTVTQFGVYDVRFQENGEWSEWSARAIEVKEKDATNTPDIVTESLQTNIIPDPNGSMGVSLLLPEGYIEYEWYMQGTANPVSSERIFNAQQSGNYFARVKEKFGCSSNDSEIFEVLSANGSNRPASISNVASFALSESSVKILWSSNAATAYPVTGFEIFRSEASGSGYELIYVANSEALNYTDENLKANTDYYYLVRPINEFTSAPVSEEAHVKTLVDSKPPSVPMNLRVVSTFPDQVTLTWDESTDDVAVYRYDVYKNGIKSKVTESNTVTMFNLNKGEPYQFMVKARDLTGNESPFSEQLIAVPLTSGLTYGYYEKTWGSNLPDFSELTPIQTGTVSNFDISVSPVTSDYGLLFSGVINIPVAGNYTFETRSDDGSKLYIGEYTESNLVVNNDGSHGMRYREGTYYFSEPGSYPIHLAFYQGGGGYGLQVYWKNTPHGVSSRQLIPDAYLVDEYTPAGSAPNSVSGLSSIDVTYNQLTLNWEDNSNNETGFQIFRSESLSGPFEPVGIVGANVTTFEDQSVKGSTSYIYQVIANNQYGSSDPVVSLESQIGEIQHGIAAQDNATGNGYIMYSVEDVFERFSSDKPYSYNSNHLVAIKRIGDAWYYDNNNSYYSFEPEPTDVLLAAVDYSADQIQSLEGDNSDVFGIAAGFVSGDLVFLADYFNGGNNNGEFTISGTSFVRNSSRHYSVTTLPLPPVPAIVSELVFDKVEGNQLTVKWLNDASAEQYQLYRSLDNSNFLPIATLEPQGDSTYYQEEGLQVHTTYYYKVVGVNDGGSTESNSFDVATLNAIPQTNTIKDFTVKFESTFELNLYATDADNDALVISSTDLPSFGEIVDYGDGTGLLILTPRAEDEGVYSITIDYSDGYGGETSASFNLTVNDNNLPTLTSMNNQILEEGESLFLEIIATDFEGAQNLTWTSNLPDFITLNVSIDGKSSLHISPDYTNHGVYDCVISVQDQQGATAEVNFQVNVSDKDPNTQYLINISKTISAASPWTNVSGLGIVQVPSVDGASQPISFEFLTNSWNTYDKGALTIDDSGIFPDAVLRDYYYFGIFGAPETVDVKLSNLDPDMSYDISLLGSSVWTGTSDNGTTVYTVNGIEKSVYVQGNTSETADFKGVVSNAQGEVIVTMSKASDGTPTGYLNGLSISTALGFDEVPAEPRNLVAEMSGRNVSLSWIDAPFNEEGFNVYKSENQGGPYDFIGSVGQGVESFLDSEISQGIEYFYVVSSYNSNGQSIVSNEVSLSIPNTPPVINIVESVEMAYVNQETILVFDVTDDPSNTVDVTFMNLPSFVVFNQFGTGGDLVMNPDESDIGNYSFTIVATDNEGSFSTEPLSIVVDEELLYSVRLNFGKNNNEAAPWNNTSKAPSQGDVFGGLLDQVGNNSGVSITLLSSFGGVHNEAPVTGDDSGAVPDDVLQEYYYWGVFGAPDVVQLKVSGLDYNNKYKFKFSGNSTFSGLNITDNGETNYSIGSVTKSLDVQANTSNLAVIDNVVANSNGEVLITMSKGAGATVGYINGLILEAYTGDPSIFYPSGLTASSLSESEIELNWSDNSFDENQFQIERATSLNGVYSTVGTVGANVTSFVDSGLEGGGIYYYRVRAKFSGNEYSDYTTVVEASTIAYYVYVNVNGDVAYDENEPWNNLSVSGQTGDVFTGFYSNNGNPTGIEMEVLTGMQGSNDWGATTGDDSGVFPDKVMRSFYFNDRLDPKGEYVLKGLDLSYKYNLKFFGSIVTNYNIITQFSAGGMTVSNSQTNNTTEVSTIYGIEPNENGEIMFTVQEDPSSNWAIFNAFVIEALPRSTEQVSGRISSAARKNSSVTNGNYEVRYGLSTLQLGMYPNPTDDYLIINMNDAPADVAYIDIINLQGVRVYSFNKFLNSINTQVTIEEEINSLSPGLYLISVKVGGQHVVERFVKK
ncbi:fibronectin type III domain-containing protein [Reichenbachiella ulvae]|uniref:PA14 domain-containing protein n=1 Tax=Reichenbachiella ulvae TaxID=2980104 RepID=A0ABT3CN32_9BACT|nr:PA14 domain-containing protein [Reichenbachiella ulvae]MCV9385032.1 PA14 domain-containing protein [Reichenbachiella ulvae]